MGYRKRYKEDPFVLLSHKRRIPIPYSCVFLLDNVFNTKDDLSFCIGFRERNGLES